LSLNPDADDYFLTVDWGDGTIEDWSGPYSSGEIVTYSHNWSDRGTYIIKAKVKTYWRESDWGTFEVTIPKTRTMKYFKWLSLLGRFPFISHTLKLMGL
jgi:hypothetical protein